MTGPLRGRRVIIGAPGLGWRSDLRADEKTVQGSRTYVPVMREAEFYRAESEGTEVFAALVPIDRVWVEEYGLATVFESAASGPVRLVSLDDPPRRLPIMAAQSSRITGHRLIRVLDDGTCQRDLRATTELYSSGSGDICARVADELDWYAWSWSGKTPRTLEVPVHSLWLE